MFLRKIKSCGQKILLHHNPSYGRQNYLLLVMTLALAMTFIMATKALAGTDGTEFQNIYSLVLGWSKGYLGKVISLGIFLTGMGIGIMRQSLMSIVSGLAGGMAMMYAPDIIDSIVSAMV